MNKVSRLFVVFVLTFASIGCSKNKESSVLTESPIPIIESLKLFSVAVEDIDVTGDLALVNLQYSIATEFDEHEYAQVISSVATAPIGRQDMYLNPSALAAVEEMFDYAGEANIEGLAVTTGYRGYAEQEILYGGGTQAGYALPPGHSEHHTGLAVDIGVAGVSGSELGNSVQGRWLADNSYKFGLILRYPNGAEDITGINYEPWHFRYVGSAHAYYINQNNLVFEEYIQLLHKRGSLSFEKDGITYYVLHQIPQNGTIDLPDGLDSIISNDNTGGYIVTAW